MLQSRFFLISRKSVGGYWREQTRVPRENCQVLAIKQNNCYPMCLEWDLNLGSKLTCDQKWILKIPPLCRSKYVSIYFTCICYCVTKHKKFYFSFIICSIPRFKKRVAFYVPQYGNIHAILDAAKVADSLLCILSPDGGIDYVGDKCLTCIFGQGLPAVTFAVQVIFTDIIDFVVWSFSKTPLYPIFD